jgi:hypothetical protein
MEDQRLKLELLALLISSAAASTRDTSFGGVALSGMQEPFEANGWYR